MLDFNDLVARNFSLICDEFKLHFNTIDSNEVLLVARGFAIDIARDFDSVNMAYIAQEGVDIRSFPISGTEIERRFTKEDRAVYGNPVGLEETLDATLRVYAAGLHNRCKDILLGQDVWLKKLRAKDRQAWSGTPATREVKTILQNANSRELAGN
jgi:hypothetical protein